MLGPKIFGGLLLSPNIGSVFEFAEVFCFYLGLGVGLGLRLGFGVVLGLGLGSELALGQGESCVKYISTRIYTN